MAEENFGAAETISDEAAFAFEVEEQGANQDPEVQAAPDAEVVVETPEGEEAAQATPEGEDDPQPEQPQTFTVTIDGKEESVSLDELRAGYQRQADYTRKTTEFAREREVMKAGSQQLMAALQYWQIPQGVEPDWVQIAQDRNPQEFVQMQAEWQAQQKRSHQARELHERIRQQEHQTLLQQEQAQLLDRVPEWRDPSVARGELSAIVKTAGEYGFTEADVAATTDHRIILMARELARLKGADAALKTQKQSAPPRNNQRCDERRYVLRAYQARGRTASDLEARHDACPRHRNVAHDYELPFSPQSGAS